METKANNKNFMGRIIRESEIFNKQRNKKKQRVR